MSVPIGVLVVVDDYFDGIYVCTSAGASTSVCERVCMFFTLLPT